MGVDDSNTGQKVGGDHDGENRGIFFKGRILGSDHPDAAEFNLTHVCPNMFVVRVVTWRTLS